MEERGSEEHYVCNNMNLEQRVLTFDLFVSQVTVHYEQRDGAVIPKRVHTIVISVQHDDCITLDEQQKVLKEKVKPHKQTSLGSNSYVVSRSESHVCFNA